MRLIIRLYLQACDWAPEIYHALITLLVLTLQASYAVLSRRRQSPVIVLAIQNTNVSYSWCQHSSVSKVNKLQIKFFILSNFSNFSKFFKYLIKFFKFSKLIKFFTYQIHPSLLMPVKSGEHSPLQTFLNSKMTLYLVLEVD